MHHAGLETGQWSVSYLSSTTQPKAAGKNVHPPTSWQVVAAVTCS